MGTSSDGAGAQSELAALRDELNSARRLECELRQAQGALYESRRALATLLGNLPGIAYRCRNDPEWTMEFISEGCRALTGYDPADLLNNRTRAYANLIHADDRAKVWEVVQSGLRTRTPFQVAYRIRTRGGQQKWVWEQGCGVFNSDGVLLAIEGFIADVTAVRLAEESRAEQFERLARYQRAIVRLATDGALHSGDLEDAARAITATAADALKIERVGFWQFSADETELHCVTSYGRAAGQHSRCATLKISNARRYLAALCTGHPMVVTDALNDPRTAEIAESTLRPLGIKSLLCAPVRREGRVVAELCFGHFGLPREWEPEEISFACELADHAAQAILHAERRQDEDRRRALEQRVQHAQRLESLGVLAGGVAHDFNNLLTGLLGYAGLAELDTPEGSQAGAAIKQIIEIAHQAGDLTRQLLAYAGQGKTALDTIDLSQLAADVVRVIRPRFCASAVLNCQLASGHTEVSADPVQLRQVVLNLLVNASEALIDNAGSVTLCTRLVDLSGAASASICDQLDLPAGEYVCLEVSDTGCGMDAETQARIFDPFFSTKGSTHGLGLAAVQGIVRGHHGAIHVETELRRGTTFRIYLPHATGPVATPSAKAEPMERHLGCVATVLVVDCQATVRNLADSVLRRAGHTVLCAEDGSSALALIESNGSDVALMILDIDLPARVCEEVAHALHVANPQATVLLTSGYADVSAAPSIMPFKDFVFLQKPFSPRRLTEVVQHALEVILPA